MKLLKTILKIYFIQTILLVMHARGHTQNLNPPSCTKILTAELQSKTLNFPSELKLKDKIIKILMENGHIELLKTLSRLFENLENPALINNIRKSFRVYNFKYMTPDENELISFQKKWETAPVNIIENAVFDKVQTAFFALKRNLDSSYLTDLEIFYTAALVTQGGLKLKYRTHDSIINESQSIMPNQRTAATLKSFLKGTKNRNLWSNLVNNKNLRAILIRLYEDNNELRSRSSHKIINIINEIKTAKRIRIENNLKSQSRVIVFLSSALTAGLQVMYEWIDESIDEESETLKDSILRLNNRQKGEPLYKPHEDLHISIQNLIVLEDNGFELRTILLDAIEHLVTEEGVDTALIEEFLDFIDEYIFDVKRPFTPEEIRFALIQGAKAVLLPLKHKSETISAKTTEAAKSQTNKSDPLRTYNEIEIVYKNNWYPNQRKDSFKTNYNPKKRKRNNNKNVTHKDGKDTAIHTAAATTTNKTKNSKTVELTPNTELKPDVLYSFYFSRNSDLPEQSIIFDKKTIEAINKHTRNQKRFIGPILNGTTAERGRNGIRNLTTKKKLSDIHEIKPGSGPFRIILKKTGSHWETLAFRHKDKVEEYISKL